MGDESEIAELRRRVSLLEQDVEGERGVSRHILRKVTEGEMTLLDLRADMAGLRKELTERVAAVENQLVTLRADLPRIIAEAVSAVVREEFARRK
jgi:transposase